MAAFKFSKTNFKSKNFRMVPIRKSDGKDGKGKKKYKRFFRIEKYKSLNNGS